MGDEDDRDVRLEAAASLFESAADELDLAAAHARRAAEHFRGGGYRAGPPTRGPRSAT